MLGHMIEGETYRKVTVRPLCGAIHRKCGIGIEFLRPRPHETNVDFHQQSTRGRASQYGVTFYHHEQRCYTQVRVSMS